jgi:hypothetical protein
MTLSTLKIIGHKIAKSQYNVLDKQMLWCVCTTAFFYFCQIRQNMYCKFQYNVYTSLGCLYLSLGSYTLVENRKVSIKNELARISWHIRLPEA